MKSIIVVTNPLLTYMT